MQIALVSDRSHPDAPAIRRLPPGSRLLASLRSHTLDRRLARGTSPDSSVLLSVRAAQLQSPSHRRMLADGYRQALTVARRDAGPLAVPLAKAQIRRCAALIEELAALLDAGQPVDVTAIARAGMLLTDSTRSPMYLETPDGVLAATLQSVIAQLQAPPSSHGPFHKPPKEE